MANARPASYEDLWTSTFTIGFADSIAAPLGTAILRLATRNRARQSGPGT